jgi:hypothetical protein
MSDQTKERCPGCNSEIRHERVLLDVHPLSGKLAFCKHPWHEVGHDVSPVIATPFSIMAWLLSLRTERENMREFYKSVFTEVAPVAPAVAKEQIKADTLAGVFTEGSGEIMAAVFKAIGRDAVWQGFQRIADYANERVAEYAASQSAQLTKELGRLRKVSSLKTYGQWKAAYSTNNAIGYLSRLFKQVAPECEPLSDIMGLCTQIDNYIAGLTTKLDRIEKERAEAHELLDANWKDGECYLCHKSTSALAGNPSMWPYWFPFRNGNGKVRCYHMGCVVKGLERAESALSGEESH